MPPLLLCATKGVPFAAPPERHNVPMQSTVFREADVTLSGKVAYDQVTPESALCKIKGGAPSKPFCPVARHVTPLQLTPYNRPCCVSDWGKVG